MLQLSLFKKISPFGLALGLLLVTTYVIAGGPRPVTSTSVAQAGWEDIETWDFDNASDLQAWTLRDASNTDGGEYLWAEDTYTYTTGMQSVWMVGSVLTATESVTYLPLVFKRWPPIPYAPYLYEINKQPLDNTYTLTWSVAASDTPVTYTLQESTSPDFSNQIDYTSPITSYQVTGKGLGVYYYRVRGSNMWGPGEWSNTRSATVLSRHDDFNNPITGWTVRRTSSPDLNLATARYLGDTLLTGLNDRFDFAIFSPMFQAPSLPYRIVMRTRILHLGNELSYGIVFGGPGGTFCPVDRSKAGSRNGCFSHYYRLNVVWGGYLKCQVKRIDYHDPEKGGGRGSELLPFHIVDRSNAGGWHTWEIRVYDDGFAVYANGGLIGWTDDTTYIHDPYYGIFISTYEYNGATFEHDYFYVDPLPATETLPESGYLVPGGMNWYQPLP